MSKEIEPKLKTISEYLSLPKGTKFVIPEYQRGYSWDKTQCDQLWQDIEDYSDEEDYYFLGTIIIDASANKELHLIDGQQRTTTLLLLVKALYLSISVKLNNKNALSNNITEGIIKALEKKNETILRLLFQVNDVELFDHSIMKNTKSQIIQVKSNNELYKTEMLTILNSSNYENASYVTTKIKYKKGDNKFTSQFRNFKYFYDQLMGLDVIPLYNFADKLLDKCQVIEIRSWNTSQAITMFNSLNSKGLPLTDADIIAAKLYSNTKESDKTSFNEKWNSLIEKADDFNRSKIFNFDYLLRQYMYIKRAKNKDYVNFKENGELSIDVTTPGLRKYFTEIESNILLDSIEFCEDLNRLITNWESVRQIPIIKLLFKFNENAKLFLSGYLFRFKSEEIEQFKENISTIAEQFLRLFSLLSVDDLVFSSRKYKTFFFGLMVRLVDNEISEIEIVGHINKHITAMWNSDERENIKRSLTDYEENLLVYLNEYLICTERNVNFDFNENTHVEHIMPVSGRNKETIMRDAGIENLTEFQNYVNKLGNKTLLEANINESISNSWFSTKKTNFVTTSKGYKDSKYATPIELVGYHKEVWTKEDIDLFTEAATKRIFKFIFNE